MEDEIFVADDGHFVGVFDGHGGAAVSKYLRQNLFAAVLAHLNSPMSATSPAEPPIIKAEEEEEEIDCTASMDSETNNVISVDDCSHVLREAFRVVDTAVQKISHWSFQGSCAVCCMIVESGKSNNSTSTSVISGNIGDSRAVLSRSKRAVDLTVDHKPNDYKERKRVESLGGAVRWHGATDKDGRPIESTGVYRINGNLAVARAIGDRSERPHVGAEVDISVFPLCSDTDEFIILASDGLWDVMSSQESVSFVHNALISPLTSSDDPAQPEEEASTRRKAQQMIDDDKITNIARFLCEEATRKGSTDNISVVIIWLWARKT